MRKIILTIASFTMMAANINVQAQIAKDSTQSTVTMKKYQAKAPETQPFDKEAFESSNKTTIRWLGNSGFLINSRGTCVMIDPLLKGFDMPLLITQPIEPENVPHLDAVLITHSDNDHYSIPTCRDLSPNCTAFHSTQYVDSLMKIEGFPSFGHNIGDVFNVGPLQVKLTPSNHTWQNATHASKRFFKIEDACGFWIETPDGNIWVSGDSKLLPEQLNMPAPAAILLFFSPDSSWHFGLEGSVKIANAYPDTPILLAHWGSVDAPDFTPFNGDPKDLKDRVVNPGRILVLAPGEPFELKPIH